MFMFQCNCDNIISFYARLVSLLPTVTNIIEPLSRHISKISLEGSRRCLTILLQVRKYQLWRKQTGLSRYFLLLFDHRRFIPFKFIRKQFLTLKIRRYHILADASSPLYIFTQGGVTVVKRRIINQFAGCQVNNCISWFVQVIGRTGHIIDGLKFNCLFLWFKLLEFDRYERFSV